MQQITKEKPTHIHILLQSFISPPRGEKAGISILNSNTVQEYSNYSSQRVCANASKTNPKSNLLAGGDL